MGGFKLSIFFSHECSYWVVSQATVWLLTSADYFYSDFVFELDDGRVLAVEYKGEPYKTNDDSREKNQVGHQWESSNGGRCLFLMVVAKDEQGRDVRRQIADKIGKP